MSFFEIVMSNHVHCIIVLGDYGFDNRVSGGPGVTNVAVEKIHEFSLQ